MKKIYLDAEYNRLFEKIKNNENFMFFRYGDGERFIMLGKSVIAQEGWKSPDNVTNLGKALLETLSLTDDNVYYGISCPCCDRSAYYWYMTHIKNKNITFANIFVNINYRRFCNDFESIKRDAIVIANHSGINNKIGNLNVLKYYSIGNSCVDFWETDAKSLINKIIEEYGENNNLLYVVSAGPLTEPILYNLYKNNPNNCYIDFGSAIDGYVHGKNTRPYTDNSSVYGKRNCWMFSPNSVNFDVSVVLTTFKKPDALKIQLDAILKQTLKPKEIFLFQDGIVEPYSIKFNEEMINKFDDYKISKINTGVWERFKYAQSVNSEYVCLFDDDTIPGEKWLENCHFNMLFNEGVYGTIGIVLENNKDYPYKGCFRVGWNRPFSKLAKVDFVGHSWFLRKEWLNYMFNDTEKYQLYKYVAEDMCLSFKCQEHGIDTYVPPHPYNDQTLWGSIPKYGYKFGGAPTAISLNSSNYVSMNNVLHELANDGWRFNYQNDKRYVSLLSYKIKNEKLKYILKNEKLKGVLRYVIRRIKLIVNKIS